MTTELVADIAAGTATTKGSTRAVERALNLLIEVCARDSVSLTECARAADVPASTALRLLRTLESHGFVARDDSGQFGPGVWLIRLGATALGRDSLVRLCQPSMRRVVKVTGESVYLATPSSEGMAIYIAMAEGTYPIRHTSWVGKQVPLRGLAVGDALAGKVNEDGYAVGRDRLEPDVTAVAVPIRAPGGIVGALNLLGPTYRIDRETLQRYGHEVVREARRVESQLQVSTDAQEGQVSTR